MSRQTNSPTSETTDSPNSRTIEPTDADTPSTTEETTTQREPLETTIGFAGDTMVGRNLNGIYDDKDPATIWGDVQPHLQSLDGVLCNLECCLSTRGERYPDRAYYFRGNPEWAVPALNAGNITFAALANNHAMDFGEVALMDTIDALDDAGIENAGTGETLDAAWEPATFSVGGLDIAVISFSEEYDFYAASAGEPGIAWVRRHGENATTRRLLANAIERAKSTNPDLLVVSAHWGENWIERPGDRLIEFGHWLVDQGVDIVHGHSAHVIQGIEQYDDGIILHDTGDLVDDFGIKDDLGNDKSYLFELTLVEGNFEKIRLVPFHIDDGVRPATEKEAKWLRQTMRDRSDLFETTYEQAGDGLVVHF